MESRGTLFREIHKNTWLKRFTVDNKKVTVGTKKSDRSWVVFCVHDDCEAILEGYVEPRQAASHTPEWTVPLQNTLHISHALIPSEHEYEFVITLATEVIRFNAPTWEIMHEWVDTLRQKLREMKILSPKENLYSRLPEIRAPLLPTRDPTSPLPAPPPVPAALVPGIERITTTSGNTIGLNTINNTIVNNHLHPSTSQSSSRNHTDNEVSSISSTAITSISTTETAVTTQSLSTTTTTTTTATPTIPSSIVTTSVIPTTAMSNTLTQNLINMLSNPVSAYSHQLSNISSSETSSNDDRFFFEDDDFLTGTTSYQGISSLASGLINGAQSVVSNTTSTATVAESAEATTGSTPSMAELINLSESLGTSSTTTVGATILGIEHKIKNKNDLPQTSLAKTFADNVLSDPNTCPSTSSNFTGGDTDSSSIDSLSTSSFQAEPIIIPRPQTTRSSARDKRIANSQTVTKKLSNSVQEDSENTSNKNSGSTNITIIQVSSPVHKLQQTKSSSALATPITKTSNIELADDNFKSNVQIIPSNFTTMPTTNSLVSSSTSLPLSNQIVSGIIENQYGLLLPQSTPSSSTPSSSSSSSTTTTMNTDKEQQSQLDKSQQKITTVQVIGNTSAYGKLLKTSDESSSSVIVGDSSNKMTITTSTGGGGLSQKGNNIKTFDDSNNSIRNFGPITNIPIGVVSSSPSSSSSSSLPPSSSSSSSSSSMASSAGTSNTTTVQLHYEQVFITSFSPTTVTTPSTTTVQVQPTPGPSTSSTTPPISPLFSSSTTILSPKQNKIKKSSLPPSSPSSSSSSSTSQSTLTTTTMTTSHVNRINVQKTNSSSSNKSNNLISSNTPISNTTSSSTPLNHNNNSNNNNNNNNNMSSGGKIATIRENLPSPLPAIRKLLTRGMTELSITRASRKDQSTAARGRTRNTNDSAPISSTSHTESSQQNRGAIENPVVSSSQQVTEIREHRRRSSSHSDAQANRNRTASGSNNNTNNNNNNNPLESRRMQAPPQPFRSPPVDKGNFSGQMAGGSGNSRLTLREQQVIELRKEMMHPSGVRIQLRRKDCIGSIALVDAFGAVWISGWKQKEYPMLYNALHIGDRLVTIAGVTVNTAADANKIIRNVASLYVELIIKRIPFGRVYAIRREMDSQCLGLIRDGNTATIVDVVPKSLSDRHGLPPKAQSCDGLSLTCWVLTEINGRPLNLFFKDNEVRDRLNSIGRDISILVQPSDLIVKLKKQLKSLRCYKDYIVQ